MRHCYSSLQLKYTFKTRTKHKKTAKASTLCVYTSTSCQMLEPVTKAYLGRAAGPCPWAKKISVGHRKKLFGPLCVNTSGQRRFATLWNLKYATGWNAHLLSPDVVHALLLLSLNQ